MSYILFGVWFVFLIASYKGSIVILEKAKLL